MKRLPKALYHISPAANRHSIAASGVRPSYAPPEARRRAIYAVEPQAVIWAILHVASRHDVRPNELHVWSMPVNDLWRCHAGPVWYSLDVVYPLNYQTSAKAIDGYAQFLGIAL